VNLQDRNELAVIDPATDKAVARYPIEGCKGNHGMALDVEHQRAFLACQGNDRLTVFDLDTHKAIVSMPLAAGSDVVQFDAGLGRLYVGCSSGAISVFQEDDPDHFRKLADVSVQRRVHSLARGVASLGAPTRKRRSDNDSAPPNTMKSGPSQISRTSGL